MWESICATFNIILWIGAVLGLELVANTLCGVMCNVGEGKEDFSWKKLLMGIGKALAFYVCVGLLSIAFTMLPFVNAMVVDVFGVELLSSAVLDTLSTAAIFGIAAAAITVQGKKAIEGIFNLAKLSLGNLELKKKVIEEKEDE